MSDSILTYALLGSLGFAAVGCGDHGVDGNGRRTEQLRETAAFTRVHSDCELDIELVQGDEPSVTVSIDSNLQDVVRVRVDGDTLWLDQNEEIDEVVSGPHVLITVPELAAAKLDGSGRLDLAFDAPSLPLDLYLSGSGDLSFSGTTAALGAYLSGSGEMRLDGETSDVDISLSGSGAIQAKRLAATSASIDLSGSGSVSATVSESVTVDLSGSGQVDLYGDAALDGYRQSGSGDVVQH